MNADTFIKVIAVVFIFLIGMVAFPLYYTLVTGDFPGAQVFYGLQEDSDFVGFVFTVRGWFGK
jgi:hypothetical protein